MHVGKVDEPVRRLLVAEAHVTDLDPLRFHPLCVSHRQDWRREQSRQQEAATAELGRFHERVSNVGHLVRLYHGLGAKVKSPMLADCEVHFDESCLSLMNFSNAANRAAVSGRYVNSPVLRTRPKPAP